MLLIGFGLSWMNLLGSLMPCDWMVVALPRIAAAVLTGSALCHSILVQIRHLLMEIVVDQCVCAPACAHGVARERERKRKRRKKCKFFTSSLLISSLFLLLCQVLSHIQNHCGSVLPEGIDIRRDKYPSLKSIYDRNFTLHFKEFLPLSSSLCYCCKGS